MIPCTSGTVAVYIANGHESKVPVEAWSDDGVTAYVANDLPERAEASALVPAQDLTGLGTFAGFTAGTKAVLPGAGWEVVRNEKGTTERYPVLGFEVDGYGWARVLTIAGDGSAGHMLDNEELRPVGGWPEPTKTGVREEREDRPSPTPIPVRPRPVGRETRERG